MIGNKLVDFFLYCHLISIINDSEKKTQLKLLLVFRTDLGITI